MKQTNNAIKFLMAQYRAIFKNAYFKGMATALVLTAGLAAGQAQAADTEIYGYTNSIVQGWRAESTDKPMKELNESNIGWTVNALSDSDPTDLSGSGAPWTAEEVNNLTSGALTHYTGGLMESGAFGIGSNDLKFVNIIGKTNIIADEDGTMTLTSAVNGANLTLAKDGDIALNITRAHSGAVMFTGGALFAGYAASYASGESPAAGKTSPESVSVTNSTLNVKDDLYADDSVIAAFAVHSTNGNAIVSGNTLNYTSTQVKQAATEHYQNSNVGIPSQMIAAGFVRSQGGSASADNNKMYLTGKGTAANEKTDITEKGYYGGGYATIYNSTSGAKDNTSLIANSNLAELTNLKYSAAEAGKALNVFGGFAFTQASDNSEAKVGSVSATSNSLKLTDVAITSTQTDTDVLIYGGKATNKVLSVATTGKSAVNASENTVVIDAKDRSGSAINLASVTDSGAQKFIIGGLAEQQSQTSADVDITANSNAVTVQGNMSINGVDIYGARAINSVTTQDSGATTTAVNNSVNITGNSVLTNTSLIAAAISATDNNSGNGIIHSGNTVTVDSNALTIASGDNVDIAGDIANIKGKVWVKNTAGSSITFGGVLKEGAAPANNTYFNGTGSLTGKLYNQGTVSVHNELDISNGTIYALADNATLRVLKLTILVLLRLQIL